MILTIGQYIEALTSTRGRFRTLERLRPLYDDAGTPLFTVPGHKLVDFDVAVGDVPFTLRCPLQRDADAVSRLRALSERDSGLDSKFYTAWSLLENEIVLFDASGAAFEVDILARPTPVGKPLTDFLDRMTGKGDSAILAAAMDSFEELSAWARTTATGGITEKRILVASDGTLSITGFSANDETELIRGRLRAVVEANLQGTEYDFVSERNIKCVRDGGGWMYVDRLGRPVIDTVWLAASPFRGARAEVETAAGKGLIDPNGKAILDAVYEEVVWDEKWGIVAVMSEGCWSLLDRGGNPLTQEPYEWLGECSEGMVLAVKGGRCGFLDTLGREAIPFEYDDASSFSEGLALVTLNEASFFIDGRGQRI